MMLTRDAILAAADRPTREIDVPEWGGTVRLRAMTARDRDDFEMVLAEAQADGRSLPENIRAIVAARCIVGDDGAPLFSNDDVAALGEKSAAALARVYRAILETNKLGQGAIEDLAKNS